MKKAISLFVSVAMMTCLFVPAFADSAEEPVFGEPIQVISYVDENGNNVVEKIYFAPDAGSDGLTVSPNGDVSVMAEASGSGWYQKEKKISSTKDKVTIYVKAYFVWGYGDVSVSNEDGWYEGIDANSYTKVTRTDVTKGTGRFVGIFNKYAYAEYYIAMTSYIGSTWSETVRVTVSESGNVS